MLFYLCSKFIKKKKSNNMKINVIGPGAIGSLVGGLLNFKNHDISFRFNPETEEKRGDRYLRIILPDKWLKIDRITIAASEKADILIVALKRNQYGSLTKEALRKYINENGSEIIFFNCSPEDIANTVPDSIPYSIALSLVNAVMLQPQDVELTIPDSYIVHDKSKNLKKLFLPLKDFGIKPYPVDDIIPYSNSLFVYQLLYLPVAMCNTTLSYFLSFKEGRDLALRVLNEGIKTFVKNEQPLGKLPVMDPIDLMTRLEKKPEKFEQQRFKEDRSYNPVLRSFLLNKKNEVKELNGRLITMAKNAGVDPLWNWKLYQKLLKVTKYGFFSNPKELLNGLD
jgi:ketopantoate reductase